MKMNGSMDESMDTSSSEATYAGAARKSPRVDDVVTENGHCESAKNRDSLRTDAEEDDESTDGNHSGQTRSETEGRSDPLAESGEDTGASRPGRPAVRADGKASANNGDRFAHSNDSVNSDSVDNVKNKSASDSSEESNAAEDAPVIHEIHSDSENDRTGRTARYEEDTEEVDSEEDSSDDEASERTEGQPEDISSDVDEAPVSIRSDSEPEAVADDSSKGSDAGDAVDKSGEVLLVDDASNQEDERRTDRKSESPVIQEIPSDNDDCVLTEEKTPDDAKKDGDSNNIRRSSRIQDKRIFKPQKYQYDDGDDDDDESDIEEIITDPLNQHGKKNTTIVINNTKKLVDLALIKQNGKSTGGNNQKKEPTVVIIDTNSIVSGKTQVPVPPKVPFSSLPPQTLYESMAARGTTVTPLSAKPQTAPATAAASPAPPLILPSLTDDMFVVEAPSFIVPYVYEKPSLKPFREFVDILGKELDEQIKKEEQERLEKEKEIREKHEQYRKEKEAERGPQTSDKAAASEPVVETKKSKRSRRRRKDDDDASWDGESTSDSEEGISEDERPKTVIIKEKDDDSLDAIKDPMITDLTAAVTAGKDAPKSNSYFDNSLGKFFINIGMNLVQEFVQHDLLKQQKRKLHKESRSGTGNVKATEVAINSLMKNLEYSKENNAPYKFRQKKCSFCNFRTESALTLSHHLETPHMKNCVYKCNFCPYEIRSPHDILFHMEAEHNIRGRLERAPSYHQCPNCPFEDNGKGKLGRHFAACAKKFKPEHNLMPPIDWEPPAKIPKATHVRQNVMSSYQTVFAKMQTSPVTPAVVAQANRGRGRPQMIPTMKPVQGTPVVRGGVMLRQTAPQTIVSGFQNAHPGLNQIPKALQHQPSISITPLPRTTQTGSGSNASQTAQSLNNSPGGKSTFVICEICDGYIKDLEQLRNHMQWIHKVKIHPKMIYNRPPLNCQKCQFRFFTDQGLERHLLGSHGLVTSSMQEAANKSNDSGRCPICGRVYQWKLLNHVSRDHNLVLKPAHLSYKCTVCTATFGMYRQFENHVYSAHSVVAKRAADKSKGPSTAASSSKVTVTPGGSMLKPLN